MPSLAASQAPSHPTADDLRRRFRTLRRARFGSGEQTASITGGRIRRPALTAQDGGRDGRRYYAAETAPRGRAG